MTFLDPSHPSSLFRERIFHKRRLATPTPRIPLALRIEEILAEWTRWHVISRGGKLASFNRRTKAGPRPGCGYYERAEERRGPGVFSMSCNQFAARRISREVLRIFQSTEGSLSAKLHITISRFDVREMRRGGSAGCVGIHTRTHPLSPFALYIACVLPVALDKGIGRARGCCSLWLVWVRLTIWIHGTVITTPPLPPSFWSLSFHLALPPQPWHSLCLSRSHRALSSPCHAPHCPGNTSRLLPRRPSRHPLHSFPSSPRRTFATISRG